MAKPKSFYIFFSRDFATKLRIPAAFAEDHGLHHRLQLSLHLKTQPARTSWAVKIKEINGVSYFSDGWSRFVDDNNILEDKLLIFHVVGDATLHVSLFGHDACLVPGLPSSSEGTLTMEPPKKWRFVKKLTECHFADHRLDLPKKFAAATGIGEKEAIDLENWEESKWPITITYRKAGIYSLTMGWKAFLKGNKLKPGAILLFELDSDCDDVIKVVLLEGEAGEEMLVRGEYGGFIPS